MRSITGILCVVFLGSAGCAMPFSSRAPEAPPAAAEPGAGAPTAVDVPATDPVLPGEERLLDTLPVEPPALDSAAIRDSIADQTMLDQLAETVAPDTAEEIAPTWDIDVASYADHHRVQYYLDFFQGPARERMAIWLTRLPAYEPMIRSKLLAAGLPGDLTYLALIESGFSNSAVSRSRAVGMWQFMAGTAKLYRLRVDRWVDERRDPAHATDAAVRFLQDLTKRFGSPYLAAAAYNAGPGRVARGLVRVPLGEDENGDDVDPSSDEAFFQLSSTRYLRPETRDYVPKLIAAALIAKQPERYGFAPIPDTPAYAVDSLLVDGAVGLDVLAGLADTTVEVLRALNPHLLRGVTSPTHPTMVRLPVGTGAETAGRLAALPASERVRYREHVVRRGETMGGIARRYRIGLGELQDANPRARARALHIGQVLVIPILGAAPPASRRVAAAGTVSSSADRASSTTTHRVRSGETLGSIADRYHTSVRALMDWNDLPSTRIRAGQRLLVSAPAVVVAVRNEGRETHVVRRGETLSGIARRYGVSVDAIKDANGLRSSTIRSGQRLILPVAESEASALEGAGR